MCYENCLLLYKEGVRLESVTCPCGRGYWDVFQAAFTDGEKIRSGKAPSRKDYEAKVRKELSTKEYRTRIRHQWIVHFLDCEIKRKLDNKATAEGRNDGSTLRRATNELSEILRGDFDNLGLSQESAAPSAPQALAKYSVEPQRPFAPNLTQHPSAINSQGHASLQGGAYGSPMQPTSVAFATSPNLDRTSSYSSSTYQPLATSPPGADTTLPIQTTQTRRSTGYDSRGSTIQPLVKGFFLPREGLKLEVLKRYAEKGFFGGAASVMHHNTRDDKEVYFVQGEHISPPSTAGLAEIKKDSRRFSSETKTRRRRGDDHSEDSSESEHEARPQPKSRASHDPGRRSMTGGISGEENTGIGLDKPKYHSHQSMPSRTTHTSDPRQKAFDRQITSPDDVPEQPRSMHSTSSHDQVSSPARTGAPASRTTGPISAYAAEPRQKSGTNLPNTSGARYPEPANPFPRRDHGR